MKRHLSTLVFIGLGALGHGANATSTWYYQCQFSGLTHNEHGMFNWHYVRDIEEMEKIMQIDVIGICLPEGVSNFNSVCNAPSVGNGKYEIYCTKDLLGKFIVTESPKPRSSSLD